MLINTKQLTIITVIAKLSLLNRYSEANAQLAGNETSNKYKRTTQLAVGYLVDALSPVNLEGLYQG